MATSDSNFMMNVYFNSIMEQAPLPANGFRKEEITSTWPEMMMMTSQAVEGRVDPRKARDRDL